MRTSSLAFMRDDMRGSACEVARMSVDDFAERVSARVDQLGLLPVDLAAATRVHQSAAERWLKGLTKPHADHIVPLAKKLDVSVAWLLTGEDQPFDDATVLTIYETIEPLERMAKRYLAKARLTADEREELRDALAGASAARTMLGLEASSELDAEVARRLAVLRAERASLREMERTAEAGLLGEEQAPPGGDQESPPAQSAG